VVADEYRDESAREEALFSAIYARLEQDQTRSYSASFDLTAGLDRFMAWLDDHPGGEPTYLATEPPPATGGIRFRILGPMEVRVGEAWQAIGAPKWRALLAALLIHPGQVITTGRLVSEVWGVDPPPIKAENLISIYVIRLRRLIGDSNGAVLITRQGGYEFRIGHGDLDAAVFVGLVEQGRQALAEGAAERASSLLAEALGLWRGSPLADVPPTPLIADASARLRRDHRAAVMLRIESEIACGRAGEVLSELGRMVFYQPHRLRDLKPADPESEVTYRLDPGDAASHRGPGRALNAQDRYAEALAARQEAIRLDPANATTHIQLGDALATQNLYTEAVSAYREAIRIDPQNAGAFSRLGDALATQNLYTEAVTAYREAIRLDPADALSYLCLSDALRGQHEQSTAEEASQD